MVVDDDAVVRRVTRARLESSGYAVETFDGAEGCLDRMQTTAPAVLLLDLGLRGMSGMDAISLIRERFPQTVVIVVSGRDDPRIIASMIHSGAYDYIVKPIEADRLITTVRNAVERQRLATRLAELETASTDQEAIVGRAPSMRRVRRAIRRVANSSVNVFVHGESGTGKELVARAIHAGSERAAGQFVAINCAAIPKGLEESELFGHEKGAFTGATHQRTGKIEQAHGGTLFLDEVAELSATLQSKLLRVLQERSLQRVGGSEDVPVDFRLIAASHRSLKEEVARGRFRQDLFFRIVVFELVVPPLRERPGDVEVLTEHILAQQSPSLIGTVPRVPAETLAILSHYPWPGNVRELQNVLQHSIVSSNGALILPSDLPSWLTSYVPSRTSPPAAIAGAARPDDVGLLAGMTLESIEGRAVELAIRRAQGNMSAAARELGIARSTLYRKVKEHGIADA